MTVKAKVKLFPSIEEVFENPSEEYKTIFFPLLTIDLASINKGPDKVHFISVFGNGDPELSYPDDTFGYNYIKLKRVRDKYQFEGDLSLLPQIENTVAWYHEAEEIYKQHKEAYYTGAPFVADEDEKREDIDEIYADYIKGVTNYWVTRDKYLETGKFIQGGAYTYKDSDHEREIYENINAYDDEYALEYLGELLEELKIDLNDLQFVGTIKAYNYIESGEDELSLFINEKQNEVLLYSDWG